MPCGGALVGLGDQGTRLIACFLAGIHDGHPCLPCVDGVRDDGIDCGVVEVGLVLGMRRRRVADQLREPLPPNGHVEPEDALAVQV